MSESEALSKISQLASQNSVMKSYIGQGYHSTIVPPVILRNMLENPGWYTAYTPYQAEIAQGRLEMLLNFQTLCSDLTGLEMSVASLLDEASAAAEAMSMCVNVNKKRKFFVSEDVHPQTIGLVQTRADALGVEVVIGRHWECDFNDGYCGILVQYPNTWGSVESGGESYESMAKRAKEGGAMVICATDLMALTRLAPPGSW
jgi:glycine dehydrogenase